MPVGTRLNHKRIHINTHLIKMSKVLARYVHAFFLTRCGKMKRLSEEKGEKIKRVSNKVTENLLCCVIWKGLSINQVLHMHPKKNEENDRRQRRWKGDLQRV